MEEGRILCIIHIFFQGRQIDILLIKNKCVQTYSYGFNGWFKIILTILVYFMQFLCHRSVLFSKTPFYYVAVKDIFPGSKHSEY